MSLMRRRLGGPARRQPVGLRRRSRGRGETEHGRHERVAKIRRFGAHEHLATRDWPQRNFLQRRAARPLAARDPRLEAALRHDGGRLSERGASLHEDRGAACRGGARAEQAATRQRALLAHSRR
jgi:hypothetical protein